MENATLEARGLSRVYRWGGGMFTLEVESLCVRKGDVLVFLGPSGCGKSSLFDMLGLIGRPDFAERFVMRSGDREIDILHAGEGVLNRLRGDGIGYVLQRSGLIASLTVKENIILPLRLAGRDPAHSRMSGLIEKLGIGDHLRKKPSQLSGGEYQRVAIARALVHEPSLVLADEPTGQLDSFTGQDVRDLLLDTIRDTGASLLVVTHDETMFAEHAKRRFGFSVTKFGQQVVSTLVESTLLPVNRLRS